jgi:phosphomannomutase/phosphoglucomutase
MTKLFGTNGIRGITNKELTPEFASNMGLAIGTYLKGGDVAIGTDTRTSNQMLKSAVISGLLASGCDVVDVGVVPTPALQYAVKQYKLAGGVMITASHNPPEFNGIKCVDSDGTELSKEKEEKIEEIYFSKKFNLAEWSKIKSVKVDENVNEMYANGIMKCVDMDAIKNNGLKVGVECANGAGSLVSPYLLERLGCKVITLNAHPDGTFPGHPSEPTPENATDLIKAVKNVGADLGVLHDGDADRTVFVDENGTYVPGEKSLAFVGKEMLVKNGGGIIVTPVATSSCVEDLAKKHNGRVIYTRVGSPIVARVMMEKGAVAVFGGEENGGLIFPEHQYCRDGAMSAAKVIEIMIQRKKKLSELVGEVPKYFVVKAKISCPDNKKEYLLKRMAEYAKGTGNKFDTTDGTKIFTKEGWVLVRPSGTEPLCRIYGETKDLEKSKKITEEYKTLAEKIVKSG